jgi:hypothetical protein
MYETWLDRRKERRRAAEERDGATVHSESHDAECRFLF